MATSKFTFNDWLQNAFTMEYTLYGGLYQRSIDTHGELVLNDSRKYQYLVFSGRMEIEVWNRIQAAQAKGYKAMVDNHFSYLKSIFQEKVKKIRQGSPAGISKRTSELKTLIMSDIEKFISEYPEQYETIIKKKTTREIPFGAAFVTAQQYKEPLQFPHLHVPNEGTNIDPARMMPGEIEYILMDATLDFRDYLLNEQSKEDDITLNGLATFLFFRTDFNGPGKANQEAWATVLETYGFTGVFTPLSIGKKFNDMSKQSNRLDPKSDKNFRDALLLFDRFPDDAGLKRLKAEQEKRKKGTLPA